MKFWKKSPEAWYALIARLPLLSRLLAAVLGGYALAAMTAVAALILPVPVPEAVLWGMLASFLVYALVVVWVFAAVTAKQAWLGVCGVAVMLWPMWWMANQQGGI